MARWAREHVPIPGAAFRQIAKHWLRDNGFVEGTLRVAGQPIDLRDVNCPTLSIIALGDDLVPPEAARPIADVLGADDFELLELEAGHAGLTTSRKAATTTIPTLIEWLGRHSTPKEN
jgi:polyhydroxyalkanoate synthase